ncbi:urease accessory protein UreF [Congregibacter variabilis]|uniref:Urease accessory protein UreF n=1 Tax=Congregibacter variabilis TaxID=3081200 RepID=A0ABZ0I6A0_9GAMM|nr:urease accessory protein UreF [Congregibacter sp. IMCC43200]
MMHSQLHLLHLSSPALPIGAYAYSQGLEYAIEAGWLENEELSAWLRDGLQLGVAQLDLPILLRACEALAENDTDSLNDWNSQLLASRETAELLLEDQQVGAALLRLLTSLETTGLPTFRQKPAYAIAFAVACHRWGIETDAALQGYAYSWLENQITAATKLVPLGQTAAQKMLLALLKEIPEACAHAMTVDDSQIGLSLPGLAMASSRHERQHTRLFRS